ncbi:MAG: 2-phosphosulfolactate phosphatase [Bacteroidota bacterium]
MKLDVLFSPGFIEDDQKLHKSIVIMIDVLRASTTICTALNNGAREVIATDELESAARLFHNLERSSTLLGGERNGDMPAGFDLGNSPLQYTSEEVKGKTVIFTTTNGTQLFVKGRHAHERLVGSFVNMGAVLTLLSKRYHGIPTDDITLVFLCAGTNKRFSYEDAICAGAFIDSCMHLFPGSHLSDSAHAALHMYKPHENDVESFLRTTEHAQFLINKGYEDDVNYCFQLNICNVVPNIIASTIRPHPESVQQAVAVH